MSTCRVFLGRPSRSTLTATRTQCVFPSKDYVIEYGTESLTPVGPTWNEREPAGFRAREAEA